MSRRTIVAMASSSSDEGPTNAVIWVSDAEKLRAARDSLKALRTQFPDAEEIVLMEADGFGVRTSFGTLDTDALHDAEKEADDALYDDHWAELGDPEAPVAGLMEDDEMDFGSFRVHVQEDCFYVTAAYNDGDDRAESYRIPY